MIEIEAIIESIKAERIRITDHADEEANNDLISLKKARESISTGEIIEQYPDDKPYRMVYCEDPFGNIIEIYSHSYELTYSPGAYV